MYPHLVISLEIIGDQEAKKTLGKSRKQFEKRNPHHYLVVKQGEK